MCPSIEQTKPTGAENGAKKPESKLASIPDWKTIELPPNEVLKHRKMLALLR